MATVYYRENGKKENITPKEGDRYWWFKSDRVLLILTIIETTYEKEAAKWDIKLRWDHYMGLVNTTNQERSGEIVWNNDEWNAVSLIEFIQPIQEIDLAADEELCRSCRGMYFEVERDFEICGCIWCDKNKPGTTKRSESIPKSSQRSPLHPVVPVKTEV